MLFEFAAGVAGIRIDVGDSAYETDPGVAGAFASSLPTFVDENGDVVPPGEPGAIPASLFFWTSRANLPAEARLIQIWYLVPDAEPPLPASADGLAAEIVGAIVQIDAGQPFSASGVVWSATPVPEPSSAALVGFGVALVAARRAGRRRPSGEATGPQLRDAAGWPGRSTGVSRLEAYRIAQRERGRSGALPSSRHSS